MIEFIECKISGYPARTEENIKNSDVTLSFSYDFNTAGEKCTSNLCEKHGKEFIKVNLNNPLHSVERTFRITSKLSEIASKNNNSIILNCAGNGTYSIPITEDNLLSWIHRFFEDIISSPEYDFIISQGRSGGQSGADAQGIIALHQLGIPCTVLAPKGWRFRDRNHKEIYNEKLYKQRFL